MKIEYAILIYKTLVLTAGMATFSLGIWLAIRWHGLVEKRVELKIADGTIRYSGSGAVVVILASLGILYAAIWKPVEITWDPETGNIKRYVGNVIRPGDSWGLWGSDTLDLYILNEIHIVPNAVMPEPGSLDSLFPIVPDTVIPERR